MKYNTRGGGLRLRVVESSDSATRRGNYARQRRKANRLREREKIVGWLTQKGKNHNCPFCLTNNWALGDHLLSGMVFYGGNFVVGSSSYPQFFLICSNCSYTRHFMAVPVLGASALEPLNETEGGAVGSKSTS